MKNFFLLLCLATTLLRAQTDWPQVRVVAGGSGAFLPVQVVQPPNDGRYFVVEQPGTIRVYSPTHGGSEIFLDITDRALFFFGGEEGLLSVAFPPDFATKQYFYVFYTEGSELREVLSRFYVSSTNANRADASSEQIVLNLFRTATSVNSGQLAFGPDGYLYVGIGDQGFEPDRPNRAQDKKSLFGKILRLDVESSTNAYRIPPDNPFVGNADYAPEIWALGLRNPFRFSFDRATGDWFVGDVGQLTWEELNYKAAAAPAGVNFGWPIREGRYTYRTDTTVRGSTLTDPFFEMQRIEGPAAIIGGFVYRGPNSPRMNGLYFFSDFYSGTIRAAKRVGNAWQIETVGETGRFISSFGEDAAGHLYVTDYLSGEFLRLEDNGQVAPPRFSPDDEIIYSDTIVLSCISTGATLHYTFDNTEPDQTDPFVLSGGSVTVGNETTLTVRAFRSDLLPSTSVSNTYFLKAATPAYLPPHGPIFPGNLIALSSRTPGATIRYTLDGTDPGPGSAIYTTPIPYNPAVTLKARAFKSGFSDSSVTTFSHQPLRFGAIDIVGFYGDTAMRWQSKSDTTYQLQFTDDHSTWYDLVPPIPGSGGQISYTNNQVFPLRDGRSFRLRATQP